MLLSHWVMANERKINKGLSPDPLFEKYVRVVEEDGKQNVKMLLPFECLFKEARAWEVYIAVGEALTEKTYTEAQRKELREGLNRNSGKFLFKTVGTEFLATIGVTEPNLAEMYKVTQGWEATMRKSCEEEGIVP